MNIQRDSVLPVQEISNKSLPRTTHVPTSASAEEWITDWSNVLMSNTKNLVNMGPPEKLKLKTVRACVSKKYP